MRSPKLVRAEHRKVCVEIENLLDKGREAGRRCPLPEDKELYLRLLSVQMTLEWAHPLLIKTTKRKGRKREIELRRLKHNMLGPVDAILHP